jgi:3-deoxy-D-manno-octulosonate 8-phosphate phosphatase (KDO 8-P phosphatase)
MHIEEIFVEAGGSFLNSYSSFVTRATRIKAILFDWDGVFNGGVKGEGIASHFTETDSMGLNMLRLGYWLSNKKIPLMGIITGQNNKSAIQLAQREHFHTVYSGFLNKELAFKHFLKENDLEASQVAFVFDDVLDISVADLCGLRCYVKNNSSPLFDKFIFENQLADYITANKGSNYAVREVCELMIGVMGNYNETIKERIAYSETYQQYFSERNAIETSFYSADGGAVVKSIY